MGQLACMQTLLTPLYMINPSCMDPASKKYEFDLRMESKSSFQLFFYISTMNMQPKSNYTTLQNQSTIINTKWYLETLVSSLY